MQSPNHHHNKTNPAPTFMDDSVEFLVLTPIVVEVPTVPCDALLRSPLPIEKVDASPYVVVASAPRLTPMVLVPEVPTLAVVIVPV